MRAGGRTYDFAHGTFHRLLVNTIRSRDLQPAGVDKFHDCVPLKAVRASLAADGLFHGQQGNGALDADSLGRNFEIIIFVGSLGVPVLTAY